MTTAILSALPEEQAGLVASLESPEPTRHAGRRFVRGRLHDQPVVLALSGIGKVAAATTATALIERHGVSRIVFTGVAGGVGEGVSVGDVVVAEDFLQHDMDASPIFPRWEMPGYARARLACDPTLTRLLEEAARASLPGQRHHRGLVASGDRFVSRADEVHALRASLVSAGHEVLAVEMEGGAVAQVCADYGIAFAAVRTISDRADDEAHVDFARFVSTVASRYADLIVGAFLKSL